MVMMHRRCPAYSTEGRRFELGLAPGSRSRANTKASTTMRPVMMDRPTPKAQQEHVFV